VTRSSVRRETILAIVLMLSFSPGLALAQQPSGGSQAPAHAAEPANDHTAENADVAKQLSNPLANMVSIPFQFNWQVHVAPFDSTRFVLNLEPVVPFTLNENWSLIMRFILPFMGEPVTAAGGFPQSGTSDITLSLFISPSKSKVVWGIGPAFGIPTSTDPQLTSGKFSVGPTAVVLRQEGAWTVGALVNQLWSYGSVASYFTRSVNQMYLQPFVAYQMPHAVTVAVNSESTFDWEAPSGQKSTVPINAFISKVTRLGPFPFQVQGGGGYYVARPEGAQHWQVRLNFTLILPREKK